jgi:hypothetical protein
MFERAKTVSITSRTVVVVSANQRRDRFRRGHALTGEDHLDAKEVLAVGRSGHVSPIPGNHRNRILYKAPCGPMTADDGSLLGFHGWTGTALVACCVPGDGVWNGHLGQLPVHHFRGCEGRGRAESACCAGELLLLLLSVIRRVLGPGPAASVCAACQHRHCGRPRPGSRSPRGAAALIRAWLAHLAAPGAPWPAGAGSPAPMPLSTFVTVRFLSNLTVTREPSAFFMCASYTPSPASVSIR